MFENEYTIPAIIALALLAIVILLLVVFFRMRRGIKHYKSSSQKKVQNILSSFCKSNYGKLMSDINYSYKGNDYHYDYCAILPYGILNINVLDYSGVIYGDGSQSRWGATVEVKSSAGSDNPLTAQRNSNVTKTTHFDNPIGVFESANAAMRYHLSQDNVYSLKIESCAVFTTARSNISVPGKLPMCSAEMLKKWLKEGYSIDNDVNIEKVTDSIAKIAK